MKDGTPHPTGFWAEEFITETYKSMREEHRMSADGEMFIFHREDGAWKIARYMFNKFQ